MMRFTLSANGVLPQLKRERLATNFRFPCPAAQTSLLLVALVLALTGEKLWLGFAPKYLETLGAGVFVIGLFDALQTLRGAVYAYPGGWFTDHSGQRRSLRRNETAEISVNVF